MPTRDATSPRLAPAHSSESVATCGGTLAGTHRTVNADRTGIRADARVPAARDALVHEIVYSMH